MVLLLFVNSISRWLEMWSLNAETKVFKHLNQQSDIYHLLNKTILTFYESQFQLSGPQTQIWRQQWWFKTSTWEDSPRSTCRPALHHLCSAQTSLPLQLELVWKRIGFPAGRWALTRSAALFQACLKTRTKQRAALTFTASSPQSSDLSFTERHAGWATPPWENTRQNTAHAPDPDSVFWFIVSFLHAWLLTLLTHLDNKYRWMDSCVLTEATVF